MRTQGPSLPLLSGLRIPRCRELWCGSQMWLGSDTAVAVVQVGSYSSDWTPSLGTAICRGYGPKKTRKKERKKRKKGRPGDRPKSVSRMGRQREVLSLSFTLPLGCSPPFLSFLF